MAIGGAKRPPMKSLTTVPARVSATTWAGPDSGLPEATCGSPMPPTRTPITLTVFVRPSMCATSWGRTTTGSARVPATWVGDAADPAMRVTRRYPASGADRLRVVQYCETRRQVGRYTATVNLALSKRGDYVVRSAICLARSYESGTPKKLRQVSAEMDVPRTFVSQILGDLARAGLAVSFFGTNGGYCLARPPAEVSVLEVVEAAEGALAPEKCVLGDGPCRWDQVCPLHETWSGGTAALRRVLAATSLADLVERDLEIEAGTYPVPADAHGHLAFTVAVVDSVQVELAAPVVAARLRAGCSWLAPHVEAAGAEGEEILVRVGPGGPSWFGKTVALHLGTPGGTDEALVIPLMWEATGPTGLFPRLEGEIRLTSLDPERSEVSLSGRYHPPLGRAGQALDETVLTHLASATVRSLLRRIARTLEEEPAQRPWRGATRPGPPTTPAGPGKPSTGEPSVSPS